MLSRRALLAGIACAAPALGSVRRAVMTFDSVDGVPVTARYYGRGSNAVLLVPGAHGVGETWHAQAVRLARSGFRVLAMDYRGLGFSPGAGQDSDKAHLDVLGAVRRLREDGARRISVVGASWGGWAAAAAAIAEPSAIERLVLIANSTVEQPEKLNGRKLFIVARGDRDGSGRLRLDSIRDQYERAPAPKQLVVLEGASHAQFLFLSPEGERLYNEILRFLSAD